MVPSCDTVADIGCDHGKVAAALVRSGKAQRAICGDISGKSLEKARKLAREYGLESRISLREGSGLSVLETGEADAAIIAGMGGRLIARILEEGMDQAPGALVLSPNRDAALLRGWLAQNGYIIADEALVREDGRFYPILLARRGESAALSDIELEFGPVLLQKKPEALKQYVRRRIADTRAIRTRLENSASRRRQRLLDENEAKLKQYAEVETWL
jgi:tRNA (adenine22-N1)-methyltransferase